MSLRKPLARVRDRLLRAANVSRSRPLNKGALFPDPPGPGPFVDRPLTVESAAQLQLEWRPEGLRLHASEPDPQLSLLASDPQTAAGPCVFWVRTLSGADTLEQPTVYLDYGGGFSATHELTMQRAAPDLFAAEIAEGGGLVRVRFDPSLSDCDVLIGAIGLTQTAAVDGAGTELRLTGLSLAAAEAQDGMLELALNSNLRRERLVLLEFRLGGGEGVTTAVVRRSDSGDEQHELATSRGSVALVIADPGSIDGLRIHSQSRQLLAAGARAPSDADLAALFGGAASASLIRVAADSLDADFGDFLRSAAQLAADGEADLAAMQASLEEFRYRRWSREWDSLTPVEQAAAAERGRRLPVRPLISVLTPVHNPPVDWLRAAVESVRAQVYDNWELCLADDASTDPAVGEYLKAIAAEDTRIKVVFRQENGHISRASNSALELVSGEWTALLDHDDLLTPDALLSVAELANQRPDLQLIYSDEDKLTPEGRLEQTFRKPQFSPALFRSQNYLNHLTVHRTDNIRAVGGWRPGFEGAQDHDLSLRIIERIDPRSVAHIPRVLYHWRLAPGSTAIASAEKTYAFLAGLLAMEEHIQRTGVAAHVEKQPGAPFYRIRYEPPSPPPNVSLLIPTRDQAPVLRTAVESILEKTEYEAFEILILDNGSVEPETKALFEELTADPRVRVAPYPAPFNFSAINNFGARHATGQVLGLVNNDVEVISSDWLSEMVSWVSQPDVGCVGAKLYYGDGSIQHAGVVLGIGGVAGHGHKRFRRDHAGYFSRAILAHDVSAVTGACLLVRREVYEQVGGLDETNLPIAFNDVDFCLKVREAGYRNIFTPYAELYHHESVSRGPEDTPEKQARFAGEVRHMLKKWGPKLRSDPFYSPHLTLTGEDFAPRAAPG